MAYNVVMREIILIVHNVRSTHNVGSILRTADGLSANKVYLTGYTPYPAKTDDPRLPHLAHKINDQIHKTALGAETSVIWEYSSNVDTVIKKLHRGGFTVVALEQVAGSIPLPEFSPPDKIAVIVGNEVEGLEQKVIIACDAALEIPMFGNKESFNVSVAAAMALYQCKFGA